MIHKFKNRGKQSVFFSKYMYDKREIKSYSTAFLMSLAVHALLLLLIIMSSKAVLNPHKIVIIDLTLMDPVTADAGVSGDMKSSDVYEPLKKHQKTVVENVEQGIEQKKQEAKEEKTETDVKVTHDHETTHVEEPMPAVKTVSLIQDTKQIFVSENQGEKERTDTFSAHAQTTEMNVPGQGGVSGSNKTQDVGNSSGKSGGVINGYLRSHLSYIKDMIQKNITYPETARRNGWMGKVTVSFVIAHNGSVRDIEVVRSSSFGCLDKNAVKAVERSSPFPHPPAEARIIIPILYTLR